MTTNHSCIPKHAESNRNLKGISKNLLILLLLRRRIQDEDIKEKVFKDGLKALSALFFEKMRTGLQLKAIILLLLTSSLCPAFAQSNSTNRRIYVAKVYSPDKSLLNGILLSVNDSSISILNDSFDSENNKMNSNSAGIVCISFRDIERITVIRKGAFAKGVTIGATSGLITGLMIGGALDLGREAVQYIGSAGTIDPQPNDAFVGITALSVGAIGGLVGGLIGLGSSNEFQIDYEYEKFAVEQVKLRKYAKMR